MNARTAFFGFFSARQYAASGVAFEFERARGGRVVVTRIQSSPNANFPHYDDLVAVGEVGPMIGPATAAQVMAAWPSANGDAAQAADVGQTTCKTP